LRQIELNISGSWKLAQEYRDYILKKEVYHCTQIDLEKNDEYYLNLDFTILMEERKFENKQQKRAEQANKMNK